MLKREMNATELQCRAGGVEPAATRRAAYGSTPPVCPTPRRPRAADREFLFPLCCHHSNASHQVSNGALNTISKKEDPQRESNSTGCTPSCYCGSPPSRAENPLIHDAQFVKQGEMLSQWIFPNLYN